jgi:hypothetical protein
LNLLAAFDTLLQSWRAVFPQQRTFQRAHRLALSFLVCLHDHLTSKAICTTGRQFQDWTADYRVFSRSPWNVVRLFDAVMDGAIAFLRPDSTPLIMPLDDTICRKTGRKIPGVSTWRDPMSPKFHTNLISGLRFVQASLIVHPAKAGPARALPVRFQPAALPAKPRKKASEAEWLEYQKRRKQAALSKVGVSVIADIRHALNQRSATAQRPLLVPVDGSYTNREVLTHLPHNTILLGRIRHDAKLCYPVPTDPAKKGRTRRYGPAAPTPKQILADDSIGFAPVRAFAAGQLRDFKVKVVDPLFWRKAGSDRPLRLIVIKPLGYRLRNGSKLLYRDPAFLICTDLHLPIEFVLQAYVYRWEIECNHRDEKSFIGVAEGHVRNPKAVHRLPQFQVAAYSLLLLASLQAYGFARSADFFPLPKWRKDAKRPSISDLLELLRGQLVGRACSSDPQLDSINFDFIPTPHANNLKSNDSLVMPAA